MQQAANDAAQLLDAMARRLTLAADEMRQAGRNAKAQAEKETEIEQKRRQRRWMEGAERELAALIREVETRPHTR